MGIPKFFRWMSERYPAISQLIADNRIPEFDCLYLDMNGIIHNCSHKDSDSPTHRVTEDKMFIAIFNYIEHLFATIKPKKLFFMAIDGVAPRAKMNQQRARRFRTALDAERAREKAIAEGIEMPKEEPFDSNCITPGTEFMAKLTLQLKYFISKKVTEDSDWQGVEIVLSGHEVPGEGEHKIMEYIRQAKAQPNYDPNRRHCLYGLDADLIMLGLLSHDPHFCLLREEVTFGRASKSKSKELEHQNFFLMHLCLVREYLELEFQDLKEPGTLSFPFDMERVIDDFILMAFFIGNDFLPNLPHLHINEGALALMFAVYKNALPKAKGYINEGGVINLQRLGDLLDELSHVEYRFFEAENSDASWFKSKTMKGKEDVMERQKRKGQLTMSTAQKTLFKGVKEYINSRTSGVDTPPYDLPVSLPAGDRKFVQELADDLNIHWETVEDDDGNRHMRLSLAPSPSKMRPDGAEDDSSSDDEDDEEAQLAILRVIKRYEKAKVVDVSAEDAEATMEAKYEQKFQEWKNTHYQEKFGWGLDNEEELRKLTENYVQGLQWVLYYYYQGVASWPWFYKYHYSPMISDVKKGLGADMKFTLGQPFKPYQQLMGVLPDRSKKIVPIAYHELMTNKDSPIIDFYPRDFSLDMNGKKQDWEAVVKIPFIEEDRLLAAMSTKEHLLTSAEKARNGFGVSLSFTYSRDVNFTYPSSLPGYFPDIENCKCIENIFDLPTMDGLEYFHGLMGGVKLGIDARAGFPSLKTLPYGAQLGFHGVNVFQQDSRNESMVLTITETEELTKASHAKEKLGKAVFVNYPFLQEGKVVSVSDDLFMYELGSNGQVIQNPKGQREIEQFRNKADRIENRYSKALGMIIGSVESMVQIEPLRGLTKLDDGATVKNYGEIPGVETEFATQTIVDHVVSPDPRFIERVAVPVEEEFPIGSRAFFLGDFAYGRPLEVVAHENGKLSVWVSTLKVKEPDFGHDIVRNAEQYTPYTPAFALTRALNLHPLAMSKITSSLSVESSGLRLNLGLNLKFEAKKLKVLGYSRKGPHGWEYSQRAIELITTYMVKFPEFIAGISAKPKGDIYTDTDFYPPAIAKDKIKEIGAWLKSIESKSFEKVPLDAEQLDSDAVAAIQNAAEANLANVANQQEAKNIKNIPRHALLNPVDADQRISGQQFALGDRVVYVLQTGRVPIAQRGTVVGITRTARQLWLDVAFDTTYMSGTTLGDRCRPFSGSTVPAESVLNLSYKQLIASSAAGQARKGPAPQSKPLTNGHADGGIGQGGYGQPGQQLRPSAAPAPLSGTWRGAAAGQQQNGGVNGHGAQVQNRGGMMSMALRGGPPSRGGGRAGFANTNSQRGGAAQANGVGQPQQPQRIHNEGRGRGTPNTQGGAARGRGGVGSGSSGYTVIDNSDPMDGVQTRNRPMPNKSYNNVAPPANLNNGSRGGGGRGGSRGEGGRGRGRGGGGRGRGGVGSGTATASPAQPASSS